MDLSEWEEKYRPLEFLSPVDSRESQNGEFKYSLIGPRTPEFAHVLQANPANVWTLLSDGITQTIANGVHVVNREGFFVTKEPLVGDFLEVNVYAADEALDDYWHMLSDEIDAAVEEGLVARKTADYILKVIKAIDPSSVQPRPDFEECPNEELEDLSGRINEVLSLRNLTSEDWNRVESHLNYVLCTGDVPPAARRPRSPSGPSMG